MSLLEEMAKAKAKEYLSKLTADEVIDFIEKNLFIIVTAERWAELAPKVKSSIEREDARREPVAPFVFNLADYGGR